jgi:hypothetical protein
VMAPAVMAPAVMAPSVMAVMMAMSGKRDGRKG